MKKKPCIMSSLMVVGISTVVFWLILEIGARVGVYINTGDTAFLRYGFADSIHRPTEVHERFFNEQGEYIYHKCRPSDDKLYPVNRRGFRGPEIKQKNSETIRIVCLGGSTTYGLNLSYDETYPKLLQDMLNAADTTQSFEVINAGFAAFKLAHITELVRNEIVALQPDIVVLMSVFNNLHREGQDFAFTAIEAEGQSVIKKMTLQSIKILKRYSLLVMTVEEIIRKGLRDYLRDIDWRTAAKIIMSDDNSALWISYRHNLEALFEVFQQYSIRAIVLDEPFNRIEYPELAPPIDKASTILLDVCASYSNGTFVAVDAAVTAAQQEGESVWKSAYNDPVHLSRCGNAVIASVVSKTLLSHYR